MNNFTFTVATLLTGLSLLAYGQAYGQTQNQVPSNVPVPAIAAPQVTTPAAASPQQEQIPTQVQPQQAPTTSGTIISNTQPTPTLDLNALTPTEVQLRPNTVRVQPAPTLQITPDTLNNIVATINAGLPAMHDKITRFDKVEAAPNNTLLYSNTLRKITKEELARRNLGEKSFVAYLTPIERNRIYNSPQKMNFLNMGGRIQYDYHLETGEPFFTLSFSKNDFVSVP